MTSEQKVSLLKTVKDTYGLNLALAAVDLPKSTWYYHQKQKVAYEKYAHLLPILEAIARNHPEYGVSRIMPELRDKYDCDVNHKVVEQLLRVWDLRILRSTHHPKPSSIQQAITDAGEQANFGPNGGDWAVSGGLHRLHRTPVRRWTSEGHPDPHRWPREQNGVWPSCW